MSYLDVITLEEAKNHLRVEQDFNEDDASISRMIASALSFVEQYTNHILYPRSKTYYRSVTEKRIRVYDYPINNYPNHITLHFSLMHEFATDKVTLNVGYTNRDDIPSVFIEVALQIIDNWYYNYEKKANLSTIPESGKEMLFQYRRAVIT